MQRYNAVKRLYPLIVVIFLTGYLLLSWHILEAQPANGQITGQVTDEATGLPLGGVNVAVLDTQGNLIAFDLTDANGNYVNDGLAAGNYFVRAINSAGFINEVYNGILCTGFCLSTEILQGTPVEIQAGEVTSGIDFTLLPSGRITGRVTAVAGEQPLNGIEVRILDPSGNVVATAFTDTAGNYTNRSGLPTGRYFAITSNVVGFVDEIYANVLCTGFCSSPEAIRRGTRIAVIAGEETSGIDFALERSGVISGRVTEAATENPLPGGNVIILSVEGTIVTVGFTDNTGRYVTQGGIPPGTYFASTDNFIGFQNEVYDGIACRSSCADEVRQGRGTQLRVGTGQQITNINFALTRELCPADGDVDGSGTITPNDVILTWQHFLSPTTFPLNACQRTRADVNPGQGAVTPADARCIFQRFLGLASCLP